jgi:hypothetical protein
MGSRIGCFQGVAGGKLAGTFLASGFSVQAAAASGRPKRLVSEESHA